MSQENVESIRRAHERRPSKPWGWRTRLTHPRTARTYLLAFR
jgi:hypothetical protein